MPHEFHFLPGTVPGMTVEAQAAGAPGCALAGGEEPDPDWQPLLNR
ncbi:hypothetical protein [Dyella sp. GSA-30]|nr:hypothetical protein [Dyella sp. GSA-30]